MAKTPLPAKTAAQAAAHVADGVRLQDVQFRYHEHAELVLNLHQLHIPAGQLVSFLGASGCGKSTLLRLVAGLLSPTSGQVDHTGDDGRHPGMVFQSPTLVPWRTARDNVLLPAELGPSASIEKSRLDSLFQMVGFHQDDTRKRPGELSGGMQMRVSIARALVLDPRLLLLDEPFAALDDLLRMQLEEDVRRIHQQRGLTTMLVTHNISEAVFMSDRVVVLGGSPSRVMADLLIDLPDRQVELRSAPRFHELVQDVTRALYAANGVPLAGERPSIGDT